MNLNDGHGLYDNSGLIDTLIIDCNELPKLLIENQFIAFGNLLTQMFQKLQNQFLNLLLTLFHLLFQKSVETWMGPVNSWSA